MRSLPETSLAETDLAKFQDLDEREFLSKAKVGDFFLRPSSQGPNFITAVVKQPDKDEPLLIRYDIKNDKEIYSPIERTILSSTISDHIALTLKLNQLSTVKESNLTLFFETQ